MITATPSSTKNLYRIVGFERAVQMLKSEELYFAHPSKWEDPYDQGLNHKRSVDIFAQCWCRKAVSDAMWRIYSPNNLGVRIGTTIERLQAAMDIAKLQQKISFKIQNVKYLYQEELVFERIDLEKKMKEKPSFRNVIAPLFLKRNAFDHERETRVVVYQAPTDPGEVRGGVYLKINARELLRSI
jgi:Protein of unknown function (DUF2971)